MAARTLRRAQGGGRGFSSQHCVQKARRRERTDMHAASCHRRGRSKAVKITDVRAYVVDSADPAWGTAPGLGVDIDMDAVRSALHPDWEV